MLENCVLEEAFWNCVDDLIELDTGAPGAVNSKSTIASKGLSLRNMIWVGECECEW